MFGLVLAHFAAGQSDPSRCARDWLQNYSSQPDPDRFVAAIFELSRTDYFDMPNRVLVGLGFFSRLFRDNPDYVDNWLLYTRRLPEQERRLIFSALWMSGHPKGEDYLRIYADQFVGPQTAAKLEKVLARDSAAREQPRRSGMSTLYVKWGEYLASGDEQLLADILEALSNDPDVSPQDRWWLACTAAEHDAALAWCEERAASASPELRQTMELVVAAHTDRALGG